jgi:hypothetical protein
MTRMLHCVDCGEFIDPRRSELGYKHCLECGEFYAGLERESWCVVQEYGKGSYQLVTPQAAFTTLKQTNQKQPR